MSNEKDQHKGDLTSLTDTGANVLVNLLIERWGVRHVFGYPGDGINGVMEAVSFP
jgi:thiamine pyrophosphate-dependent acetolactate synthase large subunit-like protein